MRWSLSMRFRVLQLLFVVALTLGLFGNPIRRIAVRSDSFHYVSACRAQSPADPLAPREYRLEPGPDIQFRLQQRLIEAVPGDVIQLEAGHYRFSSQLDVAAHNLTIRGRGPQETILSFQSQHSGGQGIEAVGDNLVLEGFAVEDTAGNAIKALGAKNVVFRDIRVEWTGPAQASNGAYGIYPVQCQNVLIERCTAIGASDAGLYVGQCRNVIVRNSRAERNVAGIEIENTIGADVYDNVATDNAGGILVFDLPGLQVKAGGKVRVFHNRVPSNNHVNFAAPGNMVASVPSGTGVMLMATDDVEVYENEIVDNESSNVLILSYLAMGKRATAVDFDPFPQRISIHDNRVARGGKHPRGALAETLKPVLGDQFADILYDGVAPPDETEARSIRVADNDDATFINFDLSHLTPQEIAAGNYRLSRSADSLAARLEPLPAVVLPPHDAPSATDDAAVRFYRTARKMLSEYDLFEGALADHRPADGVVFYDLNTTLYSDETTKLRFIRVPQGASAEYRSEGVIEFPVGTIISKTFSYPHDLRDPSSPVRHLETRIEMRNEVGWYGFSYVWNKDQTDAELALGGAEFEVEWISAQGARRHLAYQTPNANQCLNCHAQDRQFQPLGPHARNLNREIAAASHAAHHRAASEPPPATRRQTMNQIAHFQNLGMLTGAPDVAEIPRFPVAFEPASGNVDQRARAWLDVNCAHCHNPQGSARPSGLDLRFEQDAPASIGVWKTPVAAGHGSGGHEYDIVPGKPDESILVYRLGSNDPSVRMPNVARQLVPEEGLELVRQWIADMDGAEEQRAP